jgi:hypothetical protein
MVFAMVASIALSSAQAADVPAITGKGAVDAPPLLNWPSDAVGAKEIDLTEPTANTATDLHAQMRSCDLVLSTAGNYHMALKEVWSLFVTRNQDVAGNVFYTTSPPVAFDQLKRESVQLGNFRSTCRPSVVVAPPKHIEKLKEAGLVEAGPWPVFENRGNVILVKKGNPKGIKSVWDLGRKGVRVVFPNPDYEKGAFGNYSGTIYQVAKNDPHPPKGQTAESLFDSIFNGKSGDPYKYLIGSRIHHREVTWSVAYGKADAGVIFYHLALNAVRTFPDKFEIVPLGGTTADPRPVAGNKIGVHQAVLIKGDWNSSQNTARRKLVDLLMGDEFSGILEKHGMRRPASFAEKRPSKLSSDAGKPQGRSHG